MNDELKTIKLTDIKPYWRNPRVGNVPQVKQSIKDYGYNQYIVVDKDLVIIVGHTRYKALQELALEDKKWSEVPVLISGLDEKHAKEYRIVDNQTGDQSEWILDKLTQELREIDEKVAIKYFSQEELDRLVKTSAGVINYHPVDTKDIQQNQQKLDTQMTTADGKRHLKNMVICPECGHEFEID